MLNVPCSTHFKYICHLYLLKVLTEIKIKWFLAFILWIQKQLKLFSEMLTYYQKPQFLLSDIIIKLCLEIVIYRGENGAKMTPWNFIRVQMYFSNASYRGRMQIMCTFQMQNKTNQAGVVSKLIRKGNRRFTSGRKWSKKPTKTNLTIWDDP